MYQNNSSSGVKYNSITDWFQSMLQKPNQSERKNNTNTQNSSSGVSFENPHILKPEQQDQQIKTSINISNLCVDAQQIIEDVLFCDKNKFGIININAIDKHFENILKSPTKICSNYIQHQNEKCYVCQDCQIQENKKNQKQRNKKVPIFYQDCFIKQHHKNHRYYEYQPSQLICQCDCGNIKLLKPDSFCSKHKSIISQQQDNIIEKYRSTFFDLFGYLMDLIIYLNKSNKLPWNKQSNIFDFFQEDLQSRQLASNVVQKLYYINKANKQFRKLTVQLLFNKSKYFLQLEQQNIKQNTQLNIKNYQYFNQIKSVIYCNFCSLLNTVDLSEFIILLCTDSENQDGRYNKSILRIFVQNLSLLSYQFENNSLLFNKQLQQIMATLYKLIKIQGFQYIVQDKKINPHWYFFKKTIDQYNNPKNQQINKIKKLKKQIGRIKKLYNKSKIISFLILILQLINTKQSWELISQIYFPRNVKKNETYLNENTQNSLKYYVKKCLHILSQYPQDQKIYQFFRRSVHRQCQTLTFEDMDKQILQYLTIIILSLYPSSAPLVFQPFNDLMFSDFKIENKSSCREKIQQQIKQTDANFQNLNDQFLLNNAQIKQLQQKSSKSTTNLISYNILLLKLIAIGSSASYHKLYTQQYLPKLIKQYSTQQNNNCQIRKSNQVSRFQRKLQYFLDYAYLNSQTLCFPQKQKDSETYFIILMIVTIEYYEKRNPQKLSQLIIKIWKNVLIDNKSSILSVINKLISFLQIILKTNITLIAFNNVNKKRRKQILTSLAQMPKNQIQNSEQIQNQRKLAMWFIQTLQNLDQIKRPSLIQLKNQGYLELGNSKSQRTNLHQILQQYCNYTENGQTIFKVKKIYKNEQRCEKYGKWVYDLSHLRVYQNYYKCQSSFCYTQNDFDYENSLIPGQQTIKLLQHLFNQNILYRILNHFWKCYRTNLYNMSLNNKYTNNQSLQERNQKCGYMYLFCLVQLDKINNMLEKNKVDKDRKWKKHLHNTLNRIIEDPSTVELQYCDKRGENQIIMKLMKGRIKVIKQSKIKPEIKIQATQVNKDQIQRQTNLGNRKINQKSNAIKSKKYEKYKKVQTKILQKHFINPQTEQQAQQNKQICLLCHQTQINSHKILQNTQQIQHIQNSFVYLSYLNFKNTFCTIFYGNQCNLSSTLINTCFHGVHLRCYIKLKQNNNKDGWIFLCPLCQFPTNCVLPKNPNNRHVNLVCYNLLCSSLVTNYKFYYFHETMFMLYFKHLIESLGLNSIAMPNLNGNLNIERKDQISLQLSKFNKHVLKNIQTIWNSMSEYDRKLCKQDIYDFIEKVQKKCKKDQFKWVQTVISQSVLYGLTSIQSKYNVSNQSDKSQQIKLSVKIEQMLKKLKDSIIQSQYNSIKYNVRALTNFQITEGQQENKIQQKQDKIKKSLGFKISNLPESLKKLQQNIINYTCSYCNKNIKVNISQQNINRRIVQKISQICLFCGDIICNQCQQSSKHWQSRHCDYKLSVQLNNYELRCKIKQRKYVQNIYYNDIMIPYSRRQTYEAGDDGFWLWDFKLQTVLAEFLNL